MYCPGCGVQASEGLKFCKQCGANLLSVREALTRPSNEAFDWSKTWVAEMFMTAEEQERRRGITPEIKRYNEIKGGVITASIGVGVMIFLSVFMQGVAEIAAPDARPILDRVWVAGLIPFFIGISLILNGIFVSKRIVDAHRRQSPQLPSAPTTGSLRAPSEAALPESSMPSAPDFSVVEPTTRRMPDRARAGAQREND